MRPGVRRAEGAARARARSAGRAAGERDGHARAHGRTTTTPERHVCGKRRANGPPSGAHERCAREAPQESKQRQRKCEERCDHACKGLGRPGRGKLRGWWPPRASSRAATSWRKIDPSTRLNRPQESAPDRPRRWPAPTAHHQCQPGDSNRAATKELLVLAPPLFWSQPYITRHVEAARCRSGLLATAGSPTRRALTRRPTCAPHTMRAARHHKQRTRRPPLPRARSLAVAATPKTPLPATRVARVASQVGCISLPATTTVAPGARKALPPSALTKQGPTTAASSGAPPERERMVGGVSLLRWKCPERCNRRILGVLSVWRRHGSSKTSRG